VAGIVYNEKAIFMVEIVYKFAEMEVDFVMRWFFGTNFLVNDFKTQVILKHLPQLINLE